MEANWITHIYPYMIYLFENSIPRTIQWWPLHLIWMTSNTDDLWKWPLMEADQITHIYTYMIYLFENSIQRTIQWWPLHLIWMTSNTDDLWKWPLMEADQITHIYTYMIYLFENSIQRTIQCWPLHLIWMTSNFDLQWRPTTYYIFTPTWYTFLKLAYQGQYNADLYTWFFYFWILSFNNMQLQ